MYCLLYLFLFIPMMQTWVHARQNPFYRDQELQKSTRNCINLLGIASVNGLKSALLRKNHTTKTVCVNDAFEDYIVIKITQDAVFLQHENEVIKVIIKL